MKRPAAYIADLNTYDLAGEPTAYDYKTATLARYEVDKLNDRLRYHAVELNETAAGTLVLTADRNEKTARHFGIVLVERRFLDLEIERIADEYGFFQIPRRYIWGEPEVNDLVCVG